MAHRMIWLTELHTDNTLGLYAEDISVVRAGLSAGSNVVLGSDDEFFVEETPEQIKEIMAAVNGDVRDNSWAALQSQKKEV